MGQARRVAGCILLIAAAGAVTACSHDRRAPPPTTEVVATDTAAAPVIRSVVADVQGAPPSALSVVTFAIFGGRHVWAVSGRTLFASNDAGGSWTREADLGADVRSLSFTSATKGWAGTKSGLLRTDDGGRTWRPIAAAGVPSVERVEFVDDEHGWVDAASSFLRTADGGTTWTSAQAPCRGGLFSFVSATDGWMVCQGGSAGGGFVPKDLYATRDGGRSWALVSRAGFGPATPAPDALPGYGGETDYFRLDAQHAWLATDRGGLYASSDAGATWTRVAGGGEDVEGVRFADPRRGYALLRVGTDALARTEDGGATWHQVYPAVRPLSADFIDATHAVGIGSVTDPGAVLSSADGGRTWRPVGSVPGAVAGVPDFAYSFGNPRHGWALTSRPCCGTQPAQETLYGTSDGGSSWTPLPAAGLTGYGPAFLSFVDATTGYVVGTRSPGSPAGFSLLLTRDGGRTFTLVHVLRPQGPPRFGTVSYGWRGAGGELQATQDGGGTWSTILPGYYVQTFALARDRSGWVVAQPSCRQPRAVSPTPTPVGDCFDVSLMSTTDGGRTWTRFRLGSLPAPNGVAAVDAQHAWISYGEGTTYATSDGGHTWARIDAP